MGQVGRHEASPPSSDITHPLIDKILDTHSDFCGGNGRAWTGYRNHAQRVFALARHLVGRSDVDGPIAIAAAFHDITVFQSVDYLVPNVRLMDAWLAEHCTTEWRREIALAITMHHKLRPYRGDGAWLVEPLRRADWTEVTLGFAHRGIPRSLVRRTQSGLPMGRSFLCKSGLAIATPRSPIRSIPFRSPAGAARLRR
jgi:hypothetical protein